MEVRYMTVSAGGTPVTAYTCPAGKIAKVKFLGLFAGMISLKHYHLTSKSLTVGGGQLINVFRFMSDLGAPQPDCIRMLGYGSSGGVMYGADVPKEAYLNAGESLALRGYSSEYLTVVAQIFEENL